MYTTNERDLFVAISRTNHGPCERSYLFNEPFGLFCPSNGHIFIRRYRFIVPVDAVAVFTGLDVPFTVALVFQLPLVIGTT